VLRFFRDTHYPFIAWRRYAYLVTLAILVPGILSLIVKGGPKYGIDFTGGTLLQLRFEREVPLDRLRDRLGDLDLESFELQRFGDANEVVIRAQGEEGRESALAPAVERALRADPELAANPFEVVRVEAVGPKIGSELQRKALLALAFSWILIILYIYVRFKGLKYGITPVVALIHDSILVVGVFSLLNKEITLDVVAAILTVIGYSVNDSIVVLDRIRENLRTRQRRPMAEVVNDAINQTLSRTIITGVSTLLVVLALFFVGGDVIHDFAFALLIGILTGTYSSIFVVAPLLVEWEGWFGGGGGSGTGSREGRALESANGRARPRPVGAGSGRPRSA
jgi:preprotein translocase subunit SecF